MARRIAIIQGHPDPAGDRCGHPLADAYALGAERAGHSVRRTGVARMDLPLVRSAAGWHDDEPPRDVRAAQADIAWADHLVLVYPLWLGTMPALLKGFLEQALRPAFAFGACPASGAGRWRGARPGSS